MPAADPFHIIALLLLTYCFRFVSVLDLLVFGAFSENEVCNRKEKITYLLLQVSMFLIFSMSCIFSQLSITRQAPQSPWDTLTRIFVVEQ